MYTYLNERLNEADCDSISCYANVAAYVLNEADEAEKEVEGTHDKSFIAHFKQYKKAYLAVAAALGVSVVTYILWIKYGGKKGTEVERKLLSSGVSKSEIKGMLETSDKTSIVKIISKKLRLNKENY